MKKSIKYDNVVTVAVTKHKTYDQIKPLYDLGYRDFAENKVQELLLKVDSFKDVQWHFIGHLQSNKVKHVVKHCTLIHSVDSISLLKEINKQSIIQNKTTSVLLQVNIAKENTKYGFSEESIFECLNDISHFSNILVCGMMVMGPHTDNTLEIERVFAKANTLYTSIQNQYPSLKSFKVLSMGMSSDYLLAIKHHSNMIRLGTILY